MNNMSMGNGMNNLFAGIRNFLGINRGVNNYNRCSIKILTMEDAYMQMISGNVKILDVRTEDEYNSNHISGAVLLTLDTIDENSVLNIAIHRKSSTTEINLSNSSCVKNNISFFFSFLSINLPPNFNTFVVML